MHLRGHQDERHGRRQVLRRQPRRAPAPPRLPQSQRPGKFSIPTPKTLILTLRFTGLELDLVSFALGRLRRRMGTIYTTLTTSNREISRSRRRRPEISWLASGRLITSRRRC